MFCAALAAWLMLFPGVVMVSYLFGWDESSHAFTVAVSVLILVAFGLLLLTITASFARDAQVPPLPRTVAQT